MSDSPRPGEIAARPVGRGEDFFAKHFSGTNVSSTCAPPFAARASYPALEPKTRILLMKKLILVVSAIAVSSLAYAGAGCGGSCGGEKKADAPAPAPTETAPATPKA